MWRCEAGMIISKLIQMGFERMSAPPAEAGTGQKKVSHATHSLRCGNNFEIAFEFDLQH